MLANFIFFYVFTYIVTMLGLAGTEILKKVSKLPNLSSSSGIDVFSFGLIVLTLFLRTVSFFLHIDYSIFMVLLVVAIVITMKKIDTIIEAVKKIKKIFAPVDFFILFILSMYIAYLAADTPSHYDVDLYHASLIRWIENFRITPGLANLSTRFGFISSWHFLSSLTSFSNFFPSPLHAINGWIVWVFTMFVSYKASLNLRSNTLNVIHLAGVILVMFIFSGNMESYISSPITDLPVTIITWLIFLMLLEQDNGSTLRTINLIVLPVYLTTIKLSAIPMLILTGILLLSKNVSNNIKKIGVILFLSILSIYVTTNIIVSGYPFYPFPHISIQALPWTLPKHLAIDESERIKSWAILPGAEKEIVLQMSFIEQKIAWFGTLERSEASIILILLFLVGSATKHILIKSKKIPEKNIFITLMISVIGTLFWFTSAPDFRFGYGFIIMLLASLSLISIGHTHQINIHAKDIYVLKKVAILLVTVHVLSSILVNGISSQEMKKTVILPKHYNSCENRTVMVHNLTFYLPGNPDITDQTCWNGHPGTPFLFEGFRPLGDDYADGFTLKKDTTSSYLEQSSFQIVSSSHPKIHNQSEQLPTSVRRHTLLSRIRGWR